MNYTQKLTDYLSQCISEHKQKEIARVVAQRTNHVTLVLEDVHQEHNISAALRSAECFGIQDVHIIEQKNKFKATESIAKGASKWLDIKRHHQDSGPAQQKCIESLKSQNYTIFATTPHTFPGKERYELHQVPIDRKIALVFGTELHGVSDYMLEQADGHVTIPMYGFTESFNISVSVALCLYDLTTRLRASGIDWRLSHKQQEEIVLEWYKRIVKRPDLLEKKFLENNVN